MKANDGQCINLVSTLLHRSYLPNNVGTHLQLSKLRQIGVNEIA